MNFIATCKLGLEALVAAELRRLNINVLSVEDARVRFEGDYPVMARACLWLRTAERVLYEVGSFEAKSFDALFEGVKAVRWKEYLRRDAFIHVNGKSAKSVLFSVSDCQSIAKKAIVENLKAAYRTELLPETGREVIVEIGILRDQVTVALDPCGAGLSRRGYRTYNVEAPLSETLGAAIVTLARYRADMPLIDPMCGSGTMPIEAAMIARNMAPGLGRSFSAEGWEFLEKSAFAAERERARDEARDIRPDILGRDIDARSIELCKKHAKKAGVIVDWEVAPVRGLATKKTGGALVCNPPYGERMLKKSEADALCRDMRRAFDALEGWSVSIISANRDFERVYGKTADKRRKLSNGGMPCTLYQYFAPKQGRGETTDR
ncbi:MAG TPA: class I SAM-dependent RNA methyltransferase [Clostridia bacterium]|nr:class I SAM-dependent RNA methyltransferase [Clostridia bacterium]HOS17999.1 class I SAM-dependent RNA methyltransferase [Clostridia bacterium]